MRRSAARTTNKTLFFLPVNIFSHYFGWSCASYI